MRCGHATLAATLAASRGRLAAAIYGTAAKTARALASGISAVFSSRSLVLASLGGLRLMASAPPPKAAKLGADDTPHASAMGKRMAAPILDRSKVRGTATLGVSSSAADSTPTTQKKQGLNESDLLRRDIDSCAKVRSSRWSTWFGARNNPTRETCCAPVCRRLPTEC